MRAIAERVIDGDLKPDGVAPCRRGRAIPLLLLIDGNSLTYRAFFALPTDMATASGQVTNAVFGFTSMLINLLRDHGPGAWPWPSTGPSPRSATSGSTTYKANRAAAPDILRQQMGLVRQVRRDASASPCSSWPASRPTTSSPRSPPRPATRGSTSSSSPATATSTSWSRTRTSRCSTTGGACPTTCSTTRPASRSAPASTPPLPAVRGAAGRPVRQPARRPGRGREDGGQAHQHLRRPRRHLRPPRRADAQAADQPGRARGAGPAERRGDAAGPRRAGRRHVDELDRRDRRRRRGAPPVRLPRVPHAWRPAGRGAGRGPSALAAAAGRGARGRGHRARRRPTPSRILGAVRAGGARRAARGRRGVDGQRGPLAARRAWRSSPTPAPATWPGCRPSCSTTTPCGPRSPSWWPLPRRGGRPVAAHQAKALMRSLLRRRRRRARARARHRHRRLPARPGRVALPARRAAAPLRRASSCPTDGAAAEGQLDLDGAGVSVGAAHRPPRPGRRPARRAADPGARRPGPARASTTTSRCRSCGCWPAWRTSASASTPTSCAALRDQLTAEVDRLRQAI